jgi:hypothetical protein
LRDWCYEASSREAQSEPSAEGVGRDGNASPGKPQRIRDEKNIEARKKLKKEQSFAQKTAREWAYELGCSRGLVVQLPAWKAVRDRKKGGSKTLALGRPASEPHSLDSRHEQTISVEDAEKQREELIAESNEENAADPSPLEETSPDSSPPRQRKNL